jgi:hypothetical protein
MTENNELVRPIGVLGAAQVLRFVGWIMATIGPVGGIVIAYQKVNECNGLYCVEKQSALLVGWGIGSGISALGFGCLFIAVGGYLETVVSKWKVDEIGEKALLAKLRKWYVLEK